MCIIGATSICPGRGLASKINSPSRRLTMCEMHVPIRATTSVPGDASAPELAVANLRRPGDPSLTCTSTASCRPAIFMINSPAMLILLR